MIPRSKFTDQQLADLDLAIEDYRKLLVADGRRDMYDVADLGLRLVGFRLVLDQHYGPHGRMTLQISAGPSIVHVIGARVFETSESMTLDYIAGYAGTHGHRTRDLSLRIFEERPYTEFNFGASDQKFPLIFDVKISDDERAPDKIPPTLGMILVCALPKLTMLDASFRDPKTDRIAKIVSTFEGSEQLKAEISELLVMIDRDLYAP